MGSHACLRVSGLLKWGIFYWMRVRNSNHLHEELLKSWLLGRRKVLS